MNKSIKKIALIVVILTILNVILSVNVFASEGELTISGENYMEMKSDNGNYFASTIKSMQSDESVQLKVEYEQNGEKVDVTDLCTWESEDTSVATVEKGCITAVSQKFNYTHINVVYKGIERKILVTVGKEKIGWDFEIDKTNIIVKEGEEVDLSIIAKYYGMDIALYQEVKDYWNVDWEIKDKKIAKYTEVKGIVTNRGHGTAGKVTVKGLKEGTTTLVGKVKVKNDKLAEGANNEFEVNITVCAKDGKSNFTFPGKLLDDLAQNPMKFILIVGGIGVAIGMAILGVILLIIKKIRR